MYNNNVIGEQDQDVSLARAAAICGYKSRQSLYYLLKKGEGPPCREVAGRKVFDVVALKAWADTHRKRRGKRDGHQRQET